MFYNAQNTYSNNANQYAGNYAVSNQSNAYGRGQSTGGYSNNLNSLTNTLYSLLNQLVSQLSGGNYQQAHNGSNYGGYQQSHSHNGNNHSHGFYQQNQGNNYGGYQQQGQQQYSRPYSQNNHYTIRPAAYQPYQPATFNPGQYSQNTRPAYQQPAQQPMGQQGLMGAQGFDNRPVAQQPAQHRPTAPQAGRPVINHPDARPPVQARPVNQQAVRPEPQQPMQNQPVFQQPVQNNQTPLYANAGGFEGAFASYNGMQTHKAANLQEQIAQFSQAAGRGVGTGTGLDHIVSTILADKGLDNKIASTDVRGGAYAANAMNHMFAKVAQEIGADRDGKFTNKELETIGGIVQQQYNDLFVALHGDDENGEETGFHLVQNDGANTKLNLDGKNRNAVNTIFDGFYHFGFDVENGNFLNEDGNANAKVSDVAAWLNDLYFQTPDQGKGHGAAHAAYGINNDFDGAFNTFNGKQTHKGGELQEILAQHSAKAAHGARTGTGLDSIVKNILADQGLDNKIANVDQRGGAYAANGLNHLFNDVANAIGAAQDGKFTEDELETIGGIINQQYGDVFTQLHGDDENGEETGFHLVQNDGATTTLKLDNVNRNAVNTIYDGFFHYGFDVENGRFLNEDGNANQKVSDVTNWLNEIYFDQGENAQA